MIPGSQQKGQGQQFGSQRNSNKGNLAQVKGLGVLPSDRFKAETNFGNTAIRAFAVNQRNLFNDKEFLVILLAPGREGWVSNSVLKGTQIEGNLARENDFSKGTGQILSAGLGMGKERVSQVIGAGSAVKAVQFPGQEDSEVAAEVPMVAHHVVSGVRVVAVVAPMVGAARVLVGVAVVRRMVMPVLSLAAEDEAGKNFNEDAKT